MITPHWTAKIPLKVLDEHDNCESAILKESSLIFVTRKEGETISIYTTPGGIVDHKEIRQLAKRQDIDFILCLKTDSFISGVILELLEQKRIVIGNMKDMMRIVGNQENWPYASPEVKFIMQALSQHKKVDEVIRADNRKFLIRRIGMEDVIMVPTQDYNITAQSVREAYALANDTQVILAANPYRKITGDAYIAAKHLEIDLCTWSEFLGKLNSKWN